MLVTSTGRRTSGRNPTGRDKLRRFVLTGRHVLPDGSLKSAQRIARELGVCQKSARRWLREEFPEIVPQRPSFDEVKRDRAAKRAKFRRIIRSQEDRDEYGRRLSHEALAVRVGVSYWTIRAWLREDFPVVASARVA